MKIAIFDNAAFKFSQPIIDYWKSKGHEVKFEMGANPKLAQWADLTYIDWLDNNFYSLFNVRTPKKRIAVRTIDIDVYMGRHRDPIIWTYMDDLITICQHHYDKIEREGHPPKGMHHLIRPGVDLTKFTLRKKPKGKVIGMVTGNIWECKMTFMGLQIFAMLLKKDPDWQLRIRGQYVGPEYIKLFYEHFLEVAGIKDKVQIDPPVADMNIWYEDIDYLLMTSVKEAFSYAVGEAMAKGIKPVINNFYGSDDIWPEEFIFTTADEAVEMFLKKDYEPLPYRIYILQNYNLARMLREYDKLFGT